MESSKYMTELHADHKKWIEVLQFYSDELVSYNLRLEEVVKANSKVDIKSQIEHFQNQFIRQKEVIDILKHDVNLSEKNLQVVIASNPVATDRKRTSDEPELRDQMITFEKIFVEIKEEFKKFLATIL